MVQAEALRSLTVLAPAEAAPLLWENLRQAGQKARQAERRLVHADLVSEQPLQALWQTGELRNRQTALRLVKALPRFEAAVLLMKWRPQEPLLTEQVDGLLLARLSSYGKTFFVKPAPDVLRRLLRARAADLPPKVLKALDLLEAP